MAGDGNFKWWWCSHEELEVCFGPHETRADAIAAARADLEPDDFDTDDAPGFWIALADKMVISAPAVFKADEDLSFEKVAFDAERLLERITDANEEAWGEDGFEGLVGDDAVAAEAELERLVREAQLASGGRASAVNAAVTDWVQRHQRNFKVFMFGEVQTSEFVPLERGAQ